MRQRLSTIKPNLSAQSRIARILLGCWLCAGGIVIPGSQAPSCGEIPQGMIPNGSFEESSFGASVANWTCETDVEDSRSLIVDEASSGSRAIRMTAQGHTVEWRSNKIQAVPGRTYRLGLKVNAAGERHWSFALEQCEVSVIFLDGDDNEVSTFSNEIRVLRTDGWSQAWLRVPVPKNCCALQINFRSTWPPVGEPEGPASKLSRFWYGTGAGHDGRLLIDDVMLEPVLHKSLFAERQAEIISSKRDDGLLSILILDTMTRKPLPARLRITNSDGKSFIPKDAYYYDDTGAFVNQDDTPVVLCVPSGKYRIRALHGFVEEPIEQEVVVESGKVAKTILEFDTQPTEWRREGWKAGDHHHHLFFHGHSRYPAMTIPTVCRVARAEGLDYISFQAELAWMKKYIRTNPDIRIGDFICEVAHEVTTDFWGHVNYFNAVDIPDLPAPPVLWPANYDIRKMVDKHGGFLVYTHPFGRMTDENTTARLADPRIGLIARELPIDLLLGQDCMVDMLSSEGIFDLAYKMRTLERLWNLGFKFGVGGSSDSYVDQGTRVVGGFRTFALSKQNNFIGLARAYREGRTFATNGPLIHLTVDGHPVGDTISLREPKKVRVEAVAHSWWGLSSLEIVHDGTVVAQKPRDETQQSIETNLDLPIQQSGWVYVRVYGPSSPELRNVKVGNRSVQFAMTSPIWLTVRDRPQPIRAENVVFFKAWLEAVADALPGYRENLLSRAEFGSEEDLREQEKNVRLLVEKAIKALEDLSGNK
ncbi:MAG: CehA/McbA family metallohydrolase [bacterium]